MNPSQQASVVCLYFIWLVGQFDFFIFHINFLERESLLCFYFVIPYYLFSFMQFHDSVWFRLDMVLSILPPSHWSWTLPRFIICIVNFHIIK